MSKKEVFENVALKCGLIMPISAIDNCSAEHWAEVKAILIEAIENIKQPTFSISLVSESDDVGIIQKRIVQNVYSSDIVICDVSGKNPNVMFELGMRLAFDKPTVIIKDDKTDYSFDTGIIEHITYPRDLRFSRMVAFKQLLSEKVLATYKVAQSEPDHSTFLKNFGTFKVASLNQSEVSADQAVLETMTEMQRELLRMRRHLEFLGRKSTDANRLYRRAIMLIDDYRNKNPSEPIDNNHGLIAYLESNLPASEYFDSPRTFESFANSIIRDATIFI